MYQVHADGTTVQASLEIKLQTIQKLHFLFSRFLQRYVQPSGRDQPSSQHLYNLLIRVRDFLENPQQKVAGSSDSWHGHACV